MSKAVRIFILVLVIIGILPLYIALLPDGKPGRRVKEITEDTIEELQKTDDMYGNLPYGAKISEIYVHQQLGDACVYVHVTVPEENTELFNTWLYNAGKQFSTVQNVYYFTYFVGDSHTHFGDYEESKGLSMFGKIYWTLGVGTIRDRKLVAYRPQKEKVYTLILENSGGRPVRDGMERYGTGYRMTVGEKEAQNQLLKLLQQGWELRGMYDEKGN